MAFEEEFGAEIPDEDAEKLTSVGGVITYLKEKVLNNHYRFYIFKFLKIKKIKCHYEWQRNCHYGYRCCFANCK